MDAWLRSGPIDKLPPGAMQAQPPRQGSARLWVEVVVSYVLVAAFLVVGFNFMREAIGHRHGGGRVDQLIVALVAIGLAFLFARRAIGAEHRLRGVETEADVQAQQARRQRLIRRRIRYGPVSLAVLLLIWVGLSIGMAIGAIVNVSNAQRSSFTQDHGVRVAASVVAVDNTSVCSARGGCSYTASIAVRLSSPVRGVTATTVSYPDRSDLASGDSVTVLVDPQQPGYAELPGHPNTTAVQWALGFVLAVLFVRFRQAWALGNMLEYPVWLIAGFLVPLSLFPSWVRPISWVLAPTWGIRAIRGAALGGSAWGDIGMSLLLGGAYVLLGILLVHRALDAARGKGTLALT